MSPSCSRCATRCWRRQPARASSSSSWPASTASAFRSRSPTTTVTRVRSRSSSRRSARPPARCSATSGSAAARGPGGAHGASRATSAKARKVLCVGGGLGVAPVFPQARAWKESGAYVIGVLGFRNRDLVFWEDKFRACCDELILCTDDGSAGIKDSSPRASSRRSRSTRHRGVRGHRPPIMMKGCAEATRPHKDSGPWSASKPGHGGRHRHVRRLPRSSSAGREVRLRGWPGLRRHLVDFDDLMFRLQRYKPTEREANEKFNENCGCAASPTRREARPDHGDRQRT